MYQGTLKKIRKTTASQCFRNVICTVEPLRFGLFQTAMSPYSEMRIIKEICIAR